MNPLTLFILVMLIVSATGLLYYQSYYDYFVDYNNNSIDYNMYPSYNLSSTSMGTFTSNLYSNYNSVPPIPTSCQTQGNDQCPRFCDKELTEDARDWCIQAKSPNQATQPKCNPNLYSGWIFNGKNSFTRSCNM